METGVDEMGGEKEADALNCVIFFGEVDSMISLTDLFADYVIDRFQNLPAHLLQ